MKAAIIREWGGPEALEYGEIDAPEPRDGQIRVKVEACALNHLDIFVRRGLPGVKLDLPHISGGDIVGVVESASSADGEALIGQRVLLQPIIGHGILGEHYWGGLAEYVVAPAENAIPLADEDDPFERFAALPVAYGTAHRMLYTRGRLAEGETVVILGATGGVGVACLQFAVRIGAKAIVCSGSDEKLARLREMGATGTINVAEQDFRTALKELTDGGPDVIVDYQGKSTWPDTIRSVRPGGRVLTCGATTGFEATTDLRYVWARELDVLGSNGWTREDLDAVVEMVRAGEIDPPIHAVHPLSKVHDAIAELEDRHAFGKVIVVPD
ncbi:MAG TPA: zinc-binding dehydrogenase [Solirubrobacterales bacterium]|jgi:NADPH:quinone reductase-like Zn-dependent oxidoreductase